MNIYIEWVLLKTLVFTDTTKTIKLKIKLHTSNSQKKKCLRISTRQTDLQT